MYVRCADSIGAILCSLDDTLFLLQNCITASFVRTAHFNNSFTLDFDGSADLFNFYFADAVSPFSSKLFLTLLNVRHSLTDSLDASLLFFSLLFYSFLS